MFPVRAPEPSWDAKQCAQAICHMMSHATILSLLIYTVPGCLELPVTALPC